MRRNAPPRSILLTIGCVASFVACAVGDSAVDDLTPPLNGPTVQDSGSSGTSGTTSPPTTDSGGSSGSPDSSSSADSSAPFDAGKDATVTVDSGPFDSGVDTGTPVVDAGSCVKPPPSLVCNNAPQCGCGAGQTCETTNPTSGAMACISAGATGMGRACTTVGQCALGLTCWDGACRPFCNNPGANCTVPNTTLCFTPDQPPPAVAGTPSINYNVCAITCDPRVPSTACGTNACLWFAGSKLGDCRGPGTLPRDSVCSSLGACTAGNICFNHPLFGFECEKWCRIGAAYTADCAGGLFPPYTCNDAYGVNAPVIGGIKLGLCQ